MKILTTAATTPGLKRTIVKTSLIARRTANSCLLALVCVLASTLYADPSARGGQGGGSGGGSTYEPYTFTTFAGTAGVAGSTDGIGSAASFHLPDQLGIDQVTGNIYVADAANHIIRQVTSTGIVTTIAGTPGVPGSTDGVGSAALFDVPQGVAFDPATRSVFVANTGGQTIRKLTFDATQNAWVVTTFAGLANVIGSADGTGSAARFKNPDGVTVDNSGIVYVADTSNDTIRKITFSGVVTTLAGMANKAGSTDGTGNRARFASPRGPACDSAGNIYVADRDNHTVRKVTPAGVVTTVAGNAGRKGSSDGTGASALFNFPHSVAVDSAGNIFVADAYNDLVRKITPAAVVTTLGGYPQSTGSADGTGSSARFNLPRGVACSSSGQIYVADSQNDTLRLGVH